MAITASLVKELRERTGAGMMDCKKALTATDGDMDKAIDYLREKGLSKAAKKASRVAAEGIVDAYVDEANKIAVLLEVNCETDFVANTDDYKNLVLSVAKHIAANKPADVAELANQTFLGTDKKVSDVITEAIAKIGEKIDIRRFTVYEYGNDTVGHYIHGGGKIGVLVELEGGDAEVAKDVAMHIAAANPAYLDRTQVPEAELDHEKEVLSEQAKNEGKPEKIIEKMVLGRIQKYYKEVCLVDQEFIKDPDKSIAGLLKEHNAKAKRFVRYQLGEGIEKKQEDFASEVMSFVK
ncbi:translation elongation factor Ts [Acidaminococcus sp. NSJ-142]|jgi:elongation factor Ts|uniref:translation elongation factor Ts n=1 Tax=Acidaminococcus TaxID=904 RepID=UPI000CF890D5|nr:MULTISPECIES: translation elongation factor Ts [Acidaminococcus]MCD2435510.1 translation elongation factor Ts [Acidaminococcus hominis]MCH4095217.1 translation elongation factor Ts [Acidaminococcus provencensis]RHK03477.1 elongation factor Ts [Acidaminococcus sp. AM05-11]